MGAEGGVVWVQLRKNVGPDGASDLYLLLNLVGISPSTDGGRDAVSAWMGGNLRGDANAYTDHGPDDVGVNDLSVVDEWNSCVDYINLGDLTAIWYEIQGVLETGTYLGLEEGTFQDVALETLTNPYGWDGTGRHNGDPIGTLRRAMREKYEYEGGMEAAAVDPTNTLTLRTWASLVESLIEMRHTSPTESEPYIQHHEIWT